MFYMCALCTGDHVANSDNNTQKNATPIPAHKGCAIVWKLYVPYVVEVGKIHVHTYE